MKSFRELYIDSFIRQEFLYFAMMALSSLNISFAMIQQLFNSVPACGERDSNF